MGSSCPASCEARATSFLKNSFPMFTVRLRVSINTTLSSGLMSIKKPSGAKLISGRHHSIQRAKYRFDHHTLREIVTDTGRSMRTSRLSWRRSQYSQPQVIVHPRPSTNIRRSSKRIRNNFPTGAEFTSKRHHATCLQRYRFGHNHQRRETLTSIGRCIRAPLKMIAYLFDPPIELYRQI